MSQNTQELTLLGVIRQFFGSSVQIVVAVFTLPLVWLFGHGDQQKGFLGTIIVFGVISLFLILNTFIHVRERFSNAHIAHQPFKVVLSMLRHNQPWIVMSIVIFMYWLVTTIKNQTTIYHFKYTLGNEGLVPLANGFTLAALIGVLMIIRLTDHQSKKRTMLHGILIALFGQSVIAAGVYGKWLYLLFAGVFINSIGNGIIIGLVSIMIADTIRYGASMGIQAEGILATTDDFGVNFGLGIGGLITAGLFHLSGYVANHSQNAATLTMINWNYVWIPLIIYGGMYFVLRLYDEKRILDAVEK